MWVQVPPGQGIRADFAAGRPDVADADGADRQGKADAVERGRFSRPVVFPHGGIAKQTVRAQISGKALGVVLEFRAARLGCFT